MKVAQVYDVRHEAANGVYKTVAGLVKWLPSVGVEGEAWNLTPDVSTVTFRQVAGVTVVDLPAHRRGKAMVLRLPAVTREFIEERQNEVDLINFHSVFIPSNAWLAKVLRKPYVITPNGGYSSVGLAGTNRHFKRFWLAWQEMDYLRRAAAVLAVSRAEQRELSARWPELKLRYTANAIELPDESIIPPTRTNDFVFVGRLAIDHKGLDRMVRGFAKFANSPVGKTTSSRLVLAGPDWRGCRAILEKQAGDLGVKERVVFTGSIFGAEKDKLMAGARAFVHTSRWEGLPFSILESLSFGTPVLITPETNMDEVVRQYQAGVVVDGENDQSIADGFAKLAGASESEFGELSMAAKRMVTENFIWPVAVAQVKTVYEEVLNRR